MASSTSAVRPAKEIWISTRLGAQLIHTQADYALNRDGRRCVISRVIPKPKYGG